MPGVQSPTAGALMGGRRGRLLGFGRAPAPGCPSAAQALQHCGDGGGSAQRAVPSLLRRAAGW
eukprot:5512293-Lingulodinium_polyedra.AAC.1